MNRAVILAGGRGTRLRPYTMSLPKPLMPVDDTPILEIILRQLAHCGFDHVTLAVNHQAELLKAYFHDGSRWSLRVATALLMRCVAVEQFGNLAKATFHENFFHTAEIVFGGGDGGWRIIPSANQCLAENREWPRPRGAIVIRRFAARIFVAFITTTIRLAGIAQ